ncbi:MAG: glycosyltransferase [Betaproteobacteria bacterium]
MSRPLLTVVMPVYNVAPYLPRCLDSLIAQTRPIDELIVVDDGSTDDCPRILAEYASRLPQMRVIRQDNGGLSAARNTGLALAQGEYLAFIDSDDFVAPEAYAHLLAVAQRDDLDMLLCNAHYHFEGREQDRLIYADVASSAILTGKEWLKQRLQNGRLLHMVWLHLYRRDFLEEHHFRFVPKLIHEDVIWTTQALLAANRLRYDATPLNFYRIPIRHFSPEKNRLRLEALVSSSIVNAKTLLDLAHTQANDDDILRRLLSWQAIDGAFSIFHKIEKISDLAWRKERYREVLASGLLGRLWQNTNDWKQRRRIARNYLKCILSGA